MSRYSPEHMLQKACAKFLNHALPPDVWFTAIDHATRSAVEGAEKKARGVKRGIPDLMFKFQHRTVWIELKADKGVVSDTQEGVRDVLVGNGDDWHVARSIDDVEAILRGYGLPLRATAGGVTERLQQRLDVPRKAGKPRVAKTTASRIRRIEALRAKVPF
jgi:hypothetical protein